MINTNAIRAKVVDVAVTGELTADYESKSNATTDLCKMGIVSGDVHDDEIPYDLKEGWKWVRVVDLGADSKNSFADGPFGSNLKREHYTNEKQVRIIQLSNVGELGWKDENEKYTTFEHLETIKRSEVVAGNIVIAKMMPAGRAIIVPEGYSKYVLSSDCVKFVPNDGLNTRYLCYAINSQMFRKQVLQDVHGIGRERTSLSKLKSYLLPIPPVDEQEIIVDRIDVIYDLLKEIDELQKKYIIDLSLLKDKIIDAGIRGKLTEQLIEDGDAEVLYSKIQEDKARLLKEGKIRKEKTPSPLTDNVPYKIPDNWMWVRLGSVCNEMLVPQRDKPKSFEGDIPWCRIEDIEGKYLNGTKSNQFVSQSTVDSMNLRINPAGTVISACSASIGVAAICTVRCITNQTFIGLVCNDGLYNEYLFYYLKASIKSLKKLGTGMTISYISQDKYRDMLIPLPPLSEQKRIVDRIEQILECFENS